MSAKRLEPKDPGETVPLSWDFTDDLNDAEITGTPDIVVAVDNSLFRGNDPDVSDMLEGIAEVDTAKKIVTQLVKGGIDRVEYKVTCKIDTNSTPPGRLFKTSILPVRSQ